MQAGKLRHRVTIEQREQTQDPQTGAVEETWSEVATVWASIEHLSVREFVAAQAGQAQISARIVIRYRNDIDATMRVVHSGQIYTIEGPPLPDNRGGNRHLTLMVSSGVSDE